MAEIMALATLAKGGGESSKLEAQTVTRKVLCELDRVSWPDKGNETVRVTLYADVPGGPQELCSMTTGGGALLGLDGKELAFSTLDYETSRAFPAGTNFFAKIDCADPLQTAVRMVLKE
jgi:hypothetical protein